MKRAVLWAALALLGSSSLAHADWADDEAERLRAKHEPDCLSKGYPAGPALEACVVGAGAAEAGVLDRAPLDARLTQRYGAKCRLAGYTPGTGAFGQCLLYYGDRDEAALRALLLQFAVQQRTPTLPMAQLPGAPQPGAICTSVLGNQLISRPCF